MADNQHSFVLHNVLHNDSHDVTNGHGVTLHYICVDSHCCPFR